MGGSHNILREDGLITYPHYECAWELYFCSLFNKYHHDILREDKLIFREDELGNYLSSYYRSICTPGIIEKDQNKGTKLGSPIFIC